MNEIEDLCAFADVPEPTLTEQQKAIRDAVAKAVEAGFTDHVMAAIKKKVDDAYCNLQESIEYQLKDDIAGALASFVQEHAHKSVEAILAGEEDSARRYLNCTIGSFGWNGRDNVRFDWPHWIESGPMALRRKLVDAFADLLKTERMLDLEAVIVALQKQVNELNTQRATLQEKLNEYERNR